MDKTMLRQQALQLANQRAKTDASAQDVMDEADKVLAWLSKDMATTETAKAEPVPSEPSQHESVAAVVGQGPKTDA